MILALVIAVLCIFAVPEIIDNMGGNEAGGCVWLVIVAVIFIVAAGKLI